jgi:hypothetical protein
MNRVMLPERHVPAGASGSSQSKTKLRVPSALLTIAGAARCSPHRR